MQSLVWRAMADGAVGFSTGLQYVPGTYAKTPEIIELARVAANAGGVYASHMRNEGTALEAAVAETIRVGEATGARVQISHLKVDSPSRWGASAKALALIDAARARGIDVEADQYAYTAASSTLGIRFPSWVARRRPDDDRRAPERSGRRGRGSRRRWPALLARARPRRPLVRGRRLARAGPVAERPVDEAGRASKRQGLGLADAQFEAARAADARRAARRWSITSCPTRTSIGSCGIPQVAIASDSSRAHAWRGRAASARLRQQRARARRVRARSAT